MFKRIKNTCVLIALALAVPAQAVEESRVATHYADIAHAVYADSLATALNLQQQVKAFVSAPSAASLAATRAAWKQARVPYQQSEAFRFGNPVIDDWEGQLNAWPLDEGLIDYVAEDYSGEMGNIGADLNIIANPVINLGDSSLDASTITPELLASLNELGGSEANVATGYHAIEFLLWGQDLNGTGPGAGQRPYTDYVIGANCSNGHCERRAAYLLAVTQLLVSDLEYMVGQWQPGGDYRRQLQGLPSREVFTRALYGMGSLSLGELAGERMKVALEAHSPEDEHDCFSDNTHHSHFYNALGIRNIYTGEYRRADGSLLQGPSLADLVAAQDSALDQRMRAALDATQAKLQVLVDSAESGDAAFDQLIAEGNSQGREIIGAAIAALVTQTQLLEQVAATLGIDNLNPDTAEHQF
ncbi:MAG: peptidase [Gammaproteobacteria bacterium]|nr:peptidase [Gammaproteobacteria bacterium]